MTLRRTFVPLVVVLLGSQHSIAQAADKEACIQSAERAQRLRNEQHLVAARDALRVCAQTDCPAVISQDCTQWLGEVEASVPSLTTRAFDATGGPLDGVRVTFDGAPLLTGQGLPAAEVDPGVHTLHVERAGFESVEKTITVRTGERDRVVSITMEPRPVPKSGPSAASLAFAGASVLALGSFAYFGLSGRADEHTLKTTCQPYCSGSSVDALRAKYVLADVSLIVALVSGGIATWLALTHSPAPAAR